MNPIDMLSDPETALREQRAFESRMGVEERYQTQAGDALIGPAMRVLGEDNAALQDKLKEARDDLADAEHDKRHAERRLEESRSDMGDLEKERDRIAKSHDELLEERADLLDRIAVLEKRLPKVEDVIAREGGTV